MKNRVLSVILVLTLIFSSAAILVNAESVKLGDLNDDGRVTAMDARLALRASAKIDVLDESKFTAADVDFNGRITAMDARIILRASAQIEPLPEVSTDETTTEKPDETTTEKPDETTTAKPDETTTVKPDETTTEEPSTGVVVSEYPEVIDTFFSGKFYLKCAMGEGADASVEIAANGKNYELVAGFGEMQFNIYYYRYQTYFKNPAKKTYAIYDKEAKETLSKYMDGFELDFDEILMNFEFGKVEITEDPVLTKGFFKGEECDIYTFSTDGSSYTAFYFVEEELKSIVKLDANGNETSVILVEELSSKIPSGMLTISGYKKQEILTFLISLLPEGIM